MKNYGQFLTNIASELNDSVYELFKGYLSDMHEKYNDLLESNDITIDTNDGEYRIISENVIDSIQCEELESDAYILGCFNANFLSGITDMDSEMIEALQGGGQYEVLGEYIIKNDYVPELQEQYSRYDGYGHHFSPYNGNEYYFQCGDNYYYMFRLN